MNCINPKTGQFSLIVDDLEDKGLAEEVRAHLKKCEYCQSQLTNYKRMISSLKSELKNHISKDDLLIYTSHLSNRTKLSIKNGKIEDHLLICSSCRNELKEINEAASLFENLTPGVESPCPPRWTSEEESQFISRLAKSLGVKAETPALKEYEQQGGEIPTGSSGKISWAKRALEWLVTSITDRPLNTAAILVAIIILSFGIPWAITSWWAKPDDSELVETPSVSNGTTTADLPKAEKTSAPEERATPLKNVITQAIPPITKPEHSLPGNNSSKDNGETVRSGAPPDIQNSIPLRKIRSVFIDPQTDLFRQNLRNALLQRLSAIGLATNLGENASDARLTIDEDQPGTFTFSIISGKQNIWPPFNIKFSDATPQGAEILAQMVVKKLNQDRQGPAPRSRNR
jgi:hypothetical protein